MLTRLARRIPLGLRRRSLALANRVLKVEDDPTSWSELPCRTEHLGPFSAEELRAAFTHPEARTRLEALSAALAPIELPEMTGGLNPGDQHAVHLLIRALEPVHVLEVGTHVGCSTVNIALALRDGDRSEARLWTVDIVDVNNPFTRPWEAYKSRLSPRELLREAGCEHITTFVTGKSIDCLSRGDQRFDFIFLDGDHSESVVHHELPLALLRLKPEGHILLHDYFPGGRVLWPGHPPITGPWQAVERLRRQGARLRALPFGELPWETKLGAKVTSLALVVPA